MAELKIWSELMSNLLKAKKSWIWNFPTEECRTFVWGTVFMRHIMNQNLEIFDLHDHLFEMDFVECGNDRMSTCGNYKDWCHQEQFSL